MITDLPVGPRGPKSTSGWYFSHGVKSKPACIHTSRLTMLSGTAILGSK